MCKRCLLFRAAIQGAHCSCFACVAMLDNLSPASSTAIHMSSKACMLCAPLPFRTSVACIAGLRILVRYVSWYGTYPECILWPTCGMIDLMPRHRQRRYLKPLSLCGCALHHNDFLTVRRSLYLHTYCIPAYARRGGSFPTPPADRSAKSLRPPEDRTFASMTCV